MQCNTPPPSACNGQILTTYYDPNGTCVQGVCEYRFTTQTCPTGCQNGACSTCTPGSATFSADVTDFDSLATVGPLPALASGAGYEVRSYMQVKDSYAGIPVPIYAPADMVLESSVNYRDPAHDPSDSGYAGEWALMFSASCDTQVSFAHIRQVVAAISDATDKSPGSNGIALSRVAFKAGDVIGSYTRGPGYFAWDFVVSDAATTNTFVNMPRYEDAQLKYLHTICPFDPYPADTRQKYLAILGNNNDAPVAGRKCGTVEHDKAGSAAGVWFHAPYARGQGQDARARSGNPVSLFTSEWGSVYAADLDGDATTVGFTTFRIDPSNPTFKDPETITTDYCYERRASSITLVNEGWVYFHLVSNDVMHMAWSPTGACPPSFPASGYATLYR